MRFKEVQVVGNQLSSRSVVPGGLETVLVVPRFRRFAGFFRPHVAFCRILALVKLMKIGEKEQARSRRLRVRDAKFDTSTNALIQLKRSGASAAVLKAVVAARTHRSG